MIEANPTSATTMQNTSVVYTITIGSISGLPVTFGVTGLPSGATAAFNPPSLQPPVGGTTSSALTVTLAVETPVGSYRLNVTASDGSGTHWVVVTLNVLFDTGDFAISVSPSSLVMNTTSKTAIVTVTAIGSFSRDVALSVTGLPSHMTVTFTPSVVKPPPGGIANSAMTISLGADEFGGTYPLTIVAINDTAIRSAPFTITILDLHGVPVPGGNVGFAFVFIGIGLGAAAAGVGAAFALSDQRGSEVIVYGEHYYCRKHRAPLWYIEGKLWCPLHQRHVRTE